jgi:DmsE family decaheme c-type cytochrome
MNNVHRNIVFASLAICAMAAVALVFQPARSSEPELANDVCLDCHEDAAHAMMGTAHDPTVVATVTCVSCHAGPATALHVDDPDTYRPVNPARLSADSLTAVCVACHVDPHALNLFERDPHQIANLSCTACHQMHSDKHLALLKDDENNVCLGCHASARSGFAMPTHHPVMEGVIACRDCHIEVAQSPKQQTTSGPGGTCLSCHGSFQGPFPYEHEAAVDYSVNDGGCMNCHAPHGSTYPMFLKQSYEAPHYSLCTQCHSVPKHLNNSNHGTAFAGVPCADCHVDIHGSYVSRYLLDPSLQSQGCFPGGGGCHDF